MNLSAYESNRMIPDVLSETELGRDLLETDCLLKRFTASLLHPENEIGQKYWGAVFDKFGTMKTSINTFQKVWIVPEKATVFEVDPNNPSEEFSHLAKDKNKFYAYVIENELDVLCEEDYLAFSENMAEQEIVSDQGNSYSTKDINEFCTRLFKEIILPVLKKELNAGKTFAIARQCYSAMILGTWCKRNFKDNPKFNRFFDTNNPRQLTPYIQSIESVGKDINSAHESNEVKYLELSVEDIINNLRIEDTELLDFSNKKIAELESDKSFKSASKLQKKIVEILSKRKGETHDDTLFAERKLGELYRECGELDRALKVHTKTLNTLIELNGKEDFNTLVAMSQLGRTMRAIGEYKKACELHEEVVLIRQKIIGESHPNTLLSMAVLADSFKLLGETKSVNKYLQIIINRIDEIDDKKWRSSLLEIVSILDDHNEVVAANNLIAKIVELDSNMHGEDHAQVFATIQWLAGRLKEQGDEENADKLWSEIEERQRRGTDKKAIEKHGIENMNINDYFYNQYIQLFRIGVFKHVQKYYDAMEKNIITRTYFSGAINLGNFPVSIIKIAGHRRKHNKAH